MGANKTQEPQREPTDLEKAYIAGFFDGEGSLTPRKYQSRTGNKFGRGFDFAAAIHQVDKRPLQLIQMLYGGILVFRDRSKMTNASNIWLWQLCGKHRVNKFLCDIFPYLIVKNDQAIIFFSAYRVLKTKGTGNRYSEEESYQISKFMAALYEKNLRGHQRVARY